VALWIFTCRPLLCVHEVQVGHQRYLRPILVPRVEAEVDRPGPSVLFKEDPPPVTKSKALVLTLLRLLVRPTRWATAALSLRSRFLTVDLVFAGPVVACE